MGMVIKMNGLSLELSKINGVRPLFDVAYTYIEIGQGQNEYDRKVSILDESGNFTAKLNFTKNLVRKRLASAVNFGSGGLRVYTYNALASMHI